MPAELPDTDRRLHDVVLKVRARLARLRPVRLDPDFERLVVEFTLTQLHVEHQVDDTEIARLRRECDRLLEERGTLQKTQQT